MSGWIYGADALGDELTQSPSSRLFLIQKRRSHKNAVEAISRLHRILCAVSMFMGYKITRKISIDSIHYPVATESFLLKLIILIASFILFVHIHWSNYIFCSPYLFRTERILLIQCMATIFIEL